MQIPEPVGVDAVKTYYLERRN